MKTYGVLLASLLLASSALADDATRATNEELTLATAQTTEKINWKTEQDLATPTIKVLDVDFTDKTEAISEKVSAKINEKFNKAMEEQIDLQ